MLEPIRHRGPDDQGVHVAGPAVLGHNRLSIIDLVAGHQPMATPDERYWIVFNGEIYNFPEERRVLERQGSRFRTNSDTEVILELYRRFGPASLDRLRGMFAFAIWDAREETMFLARDRLGKKPLLYAEQGGALYFASELKALLAVPGLGGEVDPAAVNLYLTFQYVPTPHTIFRGIRKLPPAHYLLWRRGGGEPRRYWTLHYEPKERLTDAAWRERFLATFDEAARLRLISDVPLGAFLSGGIDSTSTVAMLSRHVSRPLKTFTVGFADRDFDETRLARLVAEKFGTEHHEFRLQPNIVDDLPRLVWYLNEPFADSGVVPRYLLSRAVRDHVTVIVAGDGGDEAAAGYHRHVWQKVAAGWDRLPSWFRDRVAAPLFRALPVPLDRRGRLGRLKRFGLALTQSPLDRTIRWSSYFSREDKDLLIEPGAGINDHAAVQRHVAGILAASDAIDAVDRALAFDTHGYFVDDILFLGDIASMAVSLEARSPYADHKVCELFAAMPATIKMPGYGKKCFLKRVFADVLPPEILTKPKTGFSMPISSWLRRELRDLVRDTLLSARADRGWFRMDRVRQMVERHESGVAEHGFRIWSLLMLELWHRRFVDERRA